MDAEPQDDLTAAGHEVQRRFGHCLLRLQDYERLAKAIAVHHQDSAPIDGIERARAKAITKIQGKTLGTVVGALMGSFVVAEGNEGARPDQDDAPSVTWLMQTSLPEEAYNKAVADQRDLVKLRNDLVHHFLDQHDLSTLAGCLTAQDALARALDRIDEARHVMRSWAEDLGRMQGSLAEALNLPEVQDALAEGRIPWKLTGIVQALRKAAELHEQDGWVALSGAIEWVTREYPDEVPRHYGCSTWRQVVHESKLFDLRYVVSGGKRNAWYRLRPKALIVSHGVGQHRM